MKKLLLISVLFITLSVDSQELYKPNPKFGKGISSAIGEDGTLSFIYRNPSQTGMATWCNGEMKLYGDTLAVINSLMEYTMNCFNVFSKKIVVINGPDTMYYHRYRTDTIWVRK
jgi:hypothetical protein